VTSPPAVNELHAAAPDGSAPPDKNAEVVKPKRERRWSSKTDLDNAPALDGGHTQKKSRKWETKDETEIVNEMALVPAMMGGMGMGMMGMGMMGMPGMGFMEAALPVEVALPTEPALDASLAQKKNRWETKDEKEVTETALVPVGGMGMMGMGMMGMPGMSLLNIAPVTMPEPGQPGYAGAMAVMMAKQMMQSKMVLAKDPQVQKIQARLSEIAAMLAQPEMEEVQMSQRYNPDKSEWMMMDGGRSPSPPPAYDRMGKRTNTRDVRLRASLGKEQLALMEMLKKLQPLNPMIMTPAAPVKFEKKMFIPTKEYPSYNFMGSILGPRGNTQKKMERETGARIIIRGKGTIKAGAKSKHAEGTFDDEDMHVYITADNQTSIDAATKIIAELLKPKEDEDNDWKRIQLRELAMINGTLRDENDHFKNEMRQLARTQNGGAVGGATADAPWRLDGEQQEQQMTRDWDMLHGGSRPTNLSARPPQPMFALAARASANAPPWQKDQRSMPGGSALPSGGGGQQQGDCAVWVGGLPPHYDDNTLQQLFAPHGDVSSCSVVLDRATGKSRNFGFVNFRSESDGQAAIEAINALRIQDFDGRTIHARLKGTTGGPPMHNAPPLATRQPQLPPGAPPSMPQPGQPGYAGAMLAQQAMQNTAMPWQRGPNPPQPAQQPMHNTTMPQAMHNTAMPWQRVPNPPQPNQWQRALAPQAPTGGQEIEGDYDKFMDAIGGKPSLASQKPQMPAMETMAPVAMRPSMPASMPLPGQPGYAGAMMALQFTQPTMQPQFFPAFPQQQPQAPQQAQHQQTHQQLPAGWQEAVDPGSGQTYFINHLTKATTWEKPLM